MHGHQNVIIHFIITPPFTCKSQKVPLPLINIFTRFYFPICLAYITSFISLTQYFCFQQKTLIFIN